MDLVVSLFVEMAIVLMCYIKHCLSVNKRLSLANILACILSLSNFLQLYGFLHSGPFGHFFHKLMEKIFEGKKGKETVAKKVCMLQCLFFSENKIYS